MILLQSSEGLVKTVIKKRSMHNHLHKKQCDET